MCLGCFGHDPSYAAPTPIDDEPLIKPDPCKFVGQMEKILQGVRVGKNVSALPDSSTMRAASGLPPTRSVIAVDANTTAHDAILKLLSSGIQSMPVFLGNKWIGLIEVRDLIDSAVSMYRARLRATGKTCSDGGVCGPVALKTPRMAHLASEAGESRDPDGHDFIRVAHLIARLI